MSDADNVTLTKWQLGTGSRKSSKSCCHPRRMNQMKLRAMNENGYLQPARNL